MTLKQQGKIMEAIGAVLGEQAVSELIEGVMDRQEAAARVRAAARQAVVAPPAETAAPQEQPLSKKKAGV